MIEVLVWVVVFILLAGGAYLVIRTVARWVRTARENLWLKKFYHEWCGKPIMMDLIVAQGFTPAGRQTGPTKIYYRDKEVHPWDWNRRVEDFEKEHWSTTAEREIKARRRGELVDEIENIEQRSKPRSINYYDKKEDVPNVDRTRGEKSSDTGADTD